MVKIVRRNKARNFTLREIYDKRKKVLVRRDVGGLGDILMHRMIFEDFKLLMPDVEITFALPSIYHSAVSDHPFVDHIVDCKQVREDDFVIHYTTTSICGRYELRAAPNCDKHRSDIWAEHCGVRLTRHDMHIRLSEGEKGWAKGRLGGMNPGGKPTVLVAPISAMINKNLEPHQVNPLVAELESRGYYVFVLHAVPPHGVVAPCLNGITTRQWMSVIDAVDYVISVDTSVFHCAGGMRKPVVGVFGWADGITYKKYFPKSFLVQRHRDYTPGWTCGPCYNFAKCPKCPETTVRKPCITEITWKDVLNGFDKMAASCPI